MTIYKIWSTNLWQFKLDKLGLIFSKEIRSFDINYKFNGALKNLGLNTLKNLKQNYTIPLIPLPSDLISKSKIVLNSSKIISLISKSLPYIMPYKNIQSQKKKIQILIIKNSSNKKTCLKILNLMVLTFLPFLKNSKSLTSQNILSDNSGNFFFYIKDISFFSSLLDETFIGWNKKIYFNIYIKKAFMKNIFHKSFFSRILLSSLGLVCKRGHGGWLPFAFTKTFVLESTNSKKIWLG